MTEHEALAQALMEASPRVVGIRAEAEAIISALPPDACLFTVDSLAVALIATISHWETPCYPHQDHEREEAGYFAAAIIKAAKEASAESIVTAHTPPFDTVDKGDRP